MRSATTLAELLCPDDPQHSAIILPDEDRKISYAAFSQAIDTLATTLRQSGLRPGDPVAIVLPNGLEYLVAFLAATRARLIASPLNSAYKAEEFQFYLSDIGARALIGPSEAHTAHGPARELGLPI